MANKFEKDTYLYSGNAVFIEEMYEKYRNLPNSVSAEWQEFFKDYEASLPSPSWKNKDFRIITSDKESSVSDKNTNTLQKNIDCREYSDLDQLRIFGHLTSNLDPLGFDSPLSLEEIGVKKDTKNSEIYSGTIGAEIDHLNNLKEQEWLHNRLEEIFWQEQSNKEKIGLLKDLVEVEGLEQYLHKKFPGAKRFSIEGAETSIIATEYAINEASKYSVSEVVIGMAHRGRLNTLTKVLGKPYEAVLGEFMGKSSFPDKFDVSSDVKYHMGYSSDIITRSGNNVHLSLTPNPSHLEAVNPVVAGRVRAKQDLARDKKREKTMGLLIHGDAAFCGQGVVAESLMLSTLDAFETGGIFHIVINNQLGFTAEADDVHKSSRYSTEFAKIIGAPILHVNGDDVEAVAKATKLLSEYRSKFKKDAVLEIFCYRKYGHNEGDEPMYTQPLMYKAIKQKQSVVEIYNQSLISRNFIDENTLDQLKDDFRKKLDKEYENAKNYEPEAQFLEGIWHGFSRKKTEDDEILKTGINKDLLKKLIHGLCNIPEKFNLNHKLKRLFDQRLKDFENNKIDWAAAEQLAFASLLSEGYPVRLIGQDAARGTFSHRHSVLFDQQDGSGYIPLNNIADQKAYYEVADSNLSEFGVMGFEFGYSMSNPMTLAIWEAQFGDFSNGAQVIFDQFLSTTETKWLRLVGLVLLLPHGYEGQGPEHTSARLERILQLCAENNMQVIYPTTPASIFHFLRRQQLRKVRKPLIIMSPKSLLRHPKVVSKVDDISDNTQALLIIADELPAKSVKKVILCSGKIYYDLLEKREANNITDIALIRIEQLYPFPIEILNREMAKYQAKEYVWCQEEPENMGAWGFIHSRVKDKLKIGDKLKVVSRPEAASPATGYMKVHKQEQEELINKALSF